MLKVNADYTFSPTYPAVVDKRVTRQVEYSIFQLYIPSEVLDHAESEKILRTVAKFRSRQRIPALSWINSRTYAAIARSAQPLVGVGVQSKKAKRDEQYLETIINANPNCERLIILDAR